MDIFQNYIDNFDYIHRAIDLSNSCEVLQNLKSNYLPRFVIDVEDTLERLYGGYAINWVCGGQWGKVLLNIQRFTLSSDLTGHKFLMCFNGSCDGTRQKEWFEKQVEKKRHIRFIMDHIFNKSTHPPKIWWIPPPGLRTMLRLAIRYYKIPVYVSVKDHYHEVTSLSSRSIGLVAHNSEYYFLKVPKYFSSNELKLFNTSVQTKQYNLREITKHLKISAERFGILASLLGNHFISKQELADFYHVFGIVNNDDNLTVNGLANFIRNIPRNSSIEEIGLQVFRYSKHSAINDQIARFVKSVNYYNVDKNLHALDDSLESAIAKARLKLDYGVLDIATHRHRSGYLHHWILSLLKKQEIYIEVFLEFEQTGLMSAVDIFRSARAKAYSILFNQKCNANQNCTVKEWCLSPQKPYSNNGLVMPEQINIDSPHLIDLWKNEGPFVDECRFNIYLTIMKSNNDLMKNTDYVSLSYLMFCTIMRFIICNHHAPVITSNELDAFLVTAVSNWLSSPLIVQDLEMPVISVRAVHLASIFMHGLDTAIFINDVCGAPIPWDACLPWDFFDGKIFHSNYIKIKNGKTVHDLCDNQISKVSQVENMRHAILFEAISPNFSIKAKDNLSTNENSPMLSNQMLGVERDKSIPGIGRGVNKLDIDPRGGDLKVGGVTVSSWSRNKNRPSKYPSLNVEGNHSRKKTKKKVTVSGYHYYNCDRYSKTRDEEECDMTLTQINELNTGFARGCTIEESSD